MRLQSERYGLGFDDRVTPFVKLNKLREQLGADAVADADNGVDAHFHEWGIGRMWLLQSSHGPLCAWSVN